PNLPGWMTPRSGLATPTGAMTPRAGTPSASRPGTRNTSPIRSGATTPQMDGSLSLGMRHGPGHMNGEDYAQNSRSQASFQTSRRNSSEEDDRRGRGRLESIEDEEYITNDRAEEAKRRSRMGAITNDSFNFDLRDGTSRSDEPTMPARTQQGGYFADAHTPSSGSETPGGGQSYPFLAQPHTPSRGDFGSVPQTPLATESVMDEKKGQKQELMPFFTDS
ncbi:hypothetical protein KC365_g19227, partial [Hortaea werneckii]